MNGYEKWICDAAEKIADEAIIGNSPNHREMVRLFALNTIKKEHEDSLVPFEQRTFLQELVKEQKQTIAMLAQQLADKKEIIRRLTC